MRKGFKFLVLFLLLACTQAQSAGVPVVSLTMVYKGETYSFSQAVEEGRQNDYSGQVKGQDGTSRPLIFNSTLTGEAGGNFRLQYMLELGASSGNGKPPVQLQADLIMPPNRKELTAQGADWQVYLKVRDRANKLEGKHTAKDCQVTANASAAGMDIPLKLVVSPGTQASYISHIENNGTQYRYALSFLAGRPDNAGEFSLQYQLNLRTPGSDLVKTSGQTRLKPAARLKTIAKGDNWRLEVRTSKP